MKIMTNYMALSGEGRLSFIDSEILEQDDSVIRAAVDLATDNNSQKV